MALARHLLDQVRYTLDSPLQVLLRSAADRSLSLVSLPFGALAIAGIYTLWPEDHRGGYDTRTAISKVDFIGNTLLVVGSIPLVLALEQGGTVAWGWSSPVTVWCLAISGLSWLFLSIWETYLFHERGVRIEPIFPLRLAVGRVYCSCLLYVLRPMNPYLLPISCMIRI